MKTTDRIGLAIICLFMIMLFIGTRCNVKKMGQTISENSKICQDLMKKVKVLENDKLGDEELKKLRKKILILEDHLEQTNMLLYKALEDLDILSNEEYLRQIPNELEVFKPPFHMI